MEGFLKNSVFLGAESLSSDVLRLQERVRAPDLRGPRLCHQALAPAVYRAVPSLWRNLQFSDRRPFAGRPSKNVSAI